MPSSAETLTRFVETLKKERLLMRAMHPVNARSRPLRELGRTALVLCEPCSPTVLAATS
jgi:hypothetical protein